MIGKAVKVGTTVSVKDHAYLQELAESRNTTIGKIVGVAITRLLYDRSIRSILFPPDSRLKSQRNGTRRARA